MVTLILTLAHHLQSSMPPRGFLKKFPKKFNCFGEQRLPFKVLTINPDDSGEWPGEAQFATTVQSQTKFGFTLHLHSGESAFA